jgi:hypothetical protein
MGCGLSSSCSALGWPSVVTMKVTPRHSLGGTGPRCPVPIDREPRGVRYRPRSRYRAERNGAKEAPKEKKRGWNACQPNRSQ